MYLYVTETFPIYIFKRIHFFSLSLAGKRRRQAKDFPGADIIVPQIKAKTARKRVGLVSTGPPVRQHTPILSPDGQVIGEGAKLV